MDVKNKIAEWLNNPKRTYEAGVALLKATVRKWLVNPYFDKREDWAKLEYELKKVIGIENEPAAKVAVVAEKSKPTETVKETVKVPSEEEKAPAGETEAKDPEAPLKIVGKIDRDKLTPEQKEKFDNYLQNYDTTIAMHEKLKKAANDDERKEILTELVKQDELCGKLWEELENDVNGVGAETARAGETAQGEDKAKAMERLAVLNELIPQKQEALKTTKAKGGALTKQQNSLTKLLTEQAEIVAKYGKE